MSLALHVMLCMVLACVASSARDNALAAVAIATGHWQQHVTGMAGLVMFDSDICHL